ncbi:hypothetical protein [Streptomyces sp. NPDC059874]|uniref:hypothetical protein n=1 Tax=Streptomyces sp. NPDC059874 TaxID=3346983 RepID=UPI0036649DAB
MKDTTTGKVILTKAVQRVRFNLGKSIALVAKDVALMDDGTVRVTSVRTPEYSHQGVRVVTIKLDRADYRQAVQRIREFEALYITEELPLMVREGKRWVPSEHTNYGAFTVAVQLGNLDRPTYFVVDAPSLDDAYEVLTGLSFYRELLTGWEVEAFPFLPEESFTGIPDELPRFDMRREQYEQGRARWVAVTA